MIISEKLVGSEIICPDLPLWSFGLWVKVMRINLLRRRRISLRLTEYNGGR